MLGAGKAVEKNKHFWENTGEKGELRNIEKVGEVSKDLAQSGGSPVCKLP